VLKILCASYLGLSLATSCRPTAAKNCKKVTKTFKFVQNHRCWWI